MMFDGNDALWAVAVAESFRGQVERNTQPVVDEMWVAEDLTLVVTYRVGATDLGARFALDVDPTSGGVPTDSARLASDLYHNLHTDPGPQAPVDEDGRAWWGDEPAGGWESVTGSARTATLLPRHD